MITWYCTRRFLKALDIKPVESPQPSTTTLGDWYANLIWTACGNRYVFSNEKTFVSVAIPVSQHDQIEMMFNLRVGNFLSMLGVPLPTVDAEVRAIPPIQYAQARDRSQLGHLQSIVYQYQAIADHNEGRRPLSLSDAELDLSRMPHLGSFNSIPDKEVFKLFGVRRN